MKRSVGAPHPPLPDRPPIATYQEAVRRLVGIVGAQCENGDEIAAEAVASALFEIVSDIFWVGESRVRNDVKRACDELGF